MKDIWADTEPESPVDSQPVKTHETSDPRAHYVDLDALRGIAIFGVIMVHLSQFWFRTTRERIKIPLLDINLLDLFTMGFLGVTLFFLLSGYLLTWTEGKRARQGAYSFLSYAGRRALRLVPAYYVAIVVVLLTWPTNPSFVDVAVHFAFLQGLKPVYPVGMDPAFWSLTPEVVFYALLPFLVLRFRGLWQRVGILVALLALSLVTRLLMAQGVFDSPALFGGILAANRMYFFPTTLLYVFLVGVLLRMLTERNGGNLLYGHRRLSTILTIASVVMLALFPYLILQRAALHSPKLMIAEALVAVFFASALMGSPVLKPLLN